MKKLAWILALVLALLAVVGIAGAADAPSSWLSPDEMTGEASPSAANYMVGTTGNASDSTFVLIPFAEFQPASTLLAAIDALGTPGNDKYLGTGETGTLGWLDQEFTDFDTDHFDISGSGTRAAPYVITLDTLNGPWVSKEDPLAEYINVTSPVTLTAAQCTNTIINNYGASGAVEYDLAACAEGLNFIHSIGTAQNTTLDPNGTEVIYHNGTALSAGEALVNSSPAVGQMMTCIAVKTGASTWSWFCTDPGPYWVEETP